MAFNRNATCDVKRHTKDGRFHTKKSKRLPKGPRWYNAVFHESDALSLSFFFFFCSAGRILEQFHSENGQNVCFNIW